MSILSIYGDGVMLTVAGNDSMTTGKFINSEIRFGSRGDSYYEYLL